MSKYGAVDGYDHILSREDAKGLEILQRDDLLVLPYNIFADEPQPVDPMQYQSTSGSPIQRKHHRRMKSHSTLTTIELINKWTKSFIPNWAVTSSTPVESTANEIQYSVFKPVPGYEPYQSVPLEGFGNSGPTSKAAFENIVDSVVELIEFGKFLPERISAGSSGSYFVFNGEGEIVGVFKPKDEEPYGPLSPKWSKFIHRNLFPCFFGRSCLIPNLGYICESAASLLDRQLQSYIVPFTDTVFLSSPTFYYSVYDRFSQKVMRKKLPPKMGSFQLFLKGYVQADEFFKRYPLPGTRSWRSFLPVHSGGDEHRRFVWTEELLLQFREELEKLVILDYIMRNTDRGLDNWMVSITWVKKYDLKTKSYCEKPEIKIGAIDSGLSWPWKHPDEWRSFPYGWLYLPVQIIGQPFSEKTRAHYLPLLTSNSWWEESTVLFKEMFSRDTEFKQRMWKKQWAVMKGQAFNVVETLKTPGQGPLELVRRSRMIVTDQEMDVPFVMPISIMANAMETPIWDNSSPGTTKLNRNLPTGSSLKADAILEEEEEGDAGKLGESDPFADHKLINNNKLTPASSPIRRNSVDNYQQGWSRLLNGDIDDREFEESFNQESPLLLATEDHHNGRSGLTNSVSPTGNDESQMESSAGLRILAGSSMATKRVIIERLQMVDSKPPVFTWC